MRHIIRIAILAALFLLLLICNKYEWGGIGALTIIALIICGITFIVRLFSGE